MRVLIWLLALPAVACAGGDTAVTTEEVQIAIERGVEFLLKDQNSDGSWGGPRNAVYTFTGAVWSNPETHRSWKAATTGLACLALLEVGDTEAVGSAVDRSVEYLLKNAAVGRPSEWDTMNCWSYIYGLQALAATYGHPRYANSPLRDEMRAVGRQLIRKLLYHQSYSGGWGYLEFDVPRTTHPQWATSFTTAAGIVALLEARTQGFDVDEAMLQRAVRAVRHCRLPSGAYTYSVPVIPDPRHSEWIDSIKGSLGRIQVCNIALRLAGDDVSAERLKIGLGHFFRYHRFLDIARNRPIPHEAYYLNSGYFYLFGHYYAALVIAQLPKDEQQEFWPRLQHEVIKIQQKDGSMWDYDMHAYHKPYGVAYGLLALGPSVERPGP